MSAENINEATSTIAGRNTTGDTDVTAVSQQLRARTSKSRAAAKHHRAHHADKSSIAPRLDGTSAGIDYPIVVTLAAGAEVHDIDGNSYVDILQGLGANLCGHNPAFVNQAVARQLEAGFPIGVQQEQVGELAKLVSELTGLPRVTFSNTGTEAVMAAIRIARTVTRKSRIVVFTNSYHGHADTTLVRAPLVEYGRRKFIHWLKNKPFLAPVSALPKIMAAVQAVPAAPGIPKSLAKDVVVLEYDSEHALGYIRRHAKNLAAVLVEPVQSRCPEIQPREFLQRLRSLTSEKNIALVFDEMVTGFRVHPAGAQGYFDVQADIATYSKVLGGGLPLSAIAGQNEYMSAIDGFTSEDGQSELKKQTTFFAGTFCKHPLAIAASSAMLSHLRARGPELQNALNDKTSSLVTRLNSYTEKNEINVRFTNFGSFFAIASSESTISPGAISSLSMYLLNEGVFLRPGDRGGFLSTEHSNDHIAKIEQAFCDGLLAQKQAGLL